MLLSVTGIPEPWQRLVSVENEVDFLGHLRAIALKEIVDAITEDNKPMDADIQADILKGLKLSLTDMGLDEFPESHAEQAALYERMAHGN